MPKRTRRVFRRTHRVCCRILSSEILRLVAPKRGLLRYYRCDTPYRTTLFEGCEHSPKMVRCPPPGTYFHTGKFCAIPHFATYRAINVRYPTKTSTKEFCDTVAATYRAINEKYRCWASKTALTKQYSAPSPILSLCWLFQACDSGTVRCLVDGKPP